VLADIYAVLEENQINLINKSLKALRDSAWLFAALLAHEPEFARPATILARDLR
jgi:hypothetical protein